MGLVVAVFIGLGVLVVVFAAGRAVHRDADAIEHWRANEMSTQDRPPTVGSAAADPSSPPQQLLVQQTAGSYRYDNLALAANSYRLVGTLLKVVGAAIVVCGPLLILVGQNTQAIVGRCPKPFGYCASSDLVGGLNQTELGFVWPPVVILTTLVLGVPVIIRAIVQTAHGEVLLAIADIAVATTSGGKPETMTTWAARRRVSPFVGMLVAALFVIIGLIGLSIAMASSIASARHETRPDIGTDERGDAGGVP